MSEPKPTSQPAVHVVQERVPSSSKAATATSPSPSGGGGGGTGVPTGPFTPQQQSAAAAKIDQRVVLGSRLLEAAEAQTRRQQQLIESLRQEQKQMKEQLEADVAKSLQQYDQWVGRMDEQFTRRIRSLEDKLDQLQSKWSDTEKHIGDMMRRAETVLDHGRSLVEQNSSRTRPASTAPAAPPPPQGLKPVQPAAKPDVAAGTPAPPPAPAPAPAGSLIYSQILSQLHRPDAQSA